MEILGHTVRLATADEIATMKPFRYTSLTDTATCPTLGALEWGFGDGQNHDEDDSKSGALNAGKACHDVFAAVRLYELITGDASLFVTQGERLYGKERFALMCAACTDKAKDGERMQRLAFCLKALYTSGYEDDPSDSKRTMANLEQTCVAYIDAWDSSRKLWVDGANVGIELKLHIIIEDGRGYKIMIQGTLDALHHSLGNPDNLCVHENKTGKYINDAWAATFRMSHQITGYCVFASVLTGKPVYDALVLGSQIPYNAKMPVRIEAIERRPHHFEQWLRWVRYNVSVYNMALVDPITAPKFAHSCNRYFSTCKHLPFCYGDDAEKGEYLARLKGDVL